MSKGFDIILRAAVDAVMYYRDINNVRINPNPDFDGARKVLRVGVHSGIKEDGLRAHFFGVPSPSVEIEINNARKAGVMYNE